MTDNERYIAMLDELYHANVLTKNAWLRARRRITDSHHGYPEPAETRFYQSVTDMDPDTASSHAAAVEAHISRPDGPRS